MVLFRERYISDWRQMATSGPSEPWRNADDFAEYSAAKGRTAVGRTAAAETKAGGVGTSKHYRGRTATEAVAAAIPAAAAAAAAASASSLHHSLSQVGAGLDEIGGRQRSSWGFDGGERKGGALFDDDGQGLGYGGAGCIGGLYGGGGGAGGGMMLDSVGVDLGSA